MECCLHDRGRLVKEFEKSCLGSIPRVCVSMHTIHTSRMHTLASSIMHIMHNMLLIRAYAYELVVCIHARTYAS